MDLLQQIYEEALRWYNLPFTVLFGLVLLYWAIQIVLGLFGAALDFDFDFDGDVDPDAVESSFLGRFSHSLSEGEAPFMWSLTFFISLMWASMMTLNHFFNPVSVWGIGIAIMAGSMAVALYITRLVMRFFSRLIRKVIGMTPQKESFIGAVGVVITHEVNDRFGEIEINHDGVPCRFSVEVEDGQSPLLKGEMAKILRRSTGRGSYIVAATDEAPRLARTETAK